MKQLIQCIVSPPQTLKGGLSHVMINEVLLSILGVPYLPACRQGNEVCHALPWVLPLCGLALVVHIVDTIIGEQPFFWGKKKMDCKTREARERGKEDRL